MRRAAAALAAVALAAAAPARKPQVGQPAPDFSLVLPDRGRLSLAELRGQVVVLNFWATWCGPCRQELPLLDSYAKAMDGHGLRVFAITTEDSLAPAKLAPLARALSIPLVRGIRGGYGDFDAVPFSYVIDRAGVLRYAQAGAFRLDDLNRLLVPLLNQPAPPAATAAIHP